eukprot:gnl/TRDRNA2_/TRDRNA2_157941_c0_seq2.p1 gnl/TRDRNA2_/TRDRNA2_157941_c0~~gnl/TRDRNA2_/TRDRNA2_157941_c0_seq2.p1  ORF type:complete len:236 (+),score=39.90 gnl/TRDRNA2_/TRDRNA2_157941_c0_seq2:254-961(+)
MLPEFLAMSSVKETVDKLIHRALRNWKCRMNLDNTMLGKPGQLDAPAVSKLETVERRRASSCSSSPKAKRGHEKKKKETVCGRRRRSRRRQSSSSSSSTSSSSSSERRRSKNKAKKQRGEAPSNSEHWLERLNGLLPQISTTTRLPQPGSLDEYLLNRLPGGNQMEEADEARKQMKIKIGDRSWIQDAKKKWTMGEKILGRKKYRKLRTKLKNKQEKEASVIAELNARFGTLPEA